MEALCFSIWRKNYKETECKLYIWDRDNDEVITMIVYLN